MNVADHALVRAAAEAQELFDADELEAYAAEHPWPAVSPVPIASEEQQLLQAFGACETCEGEGAVDWRGDLATCSDCEGSRSPLTWTCAVCEQEFPSGARPFNFTGPDACPDELVCHKPRCVRESLAIDPKCLRPEARAWYADRASEPGR